MKTELRIGNKVNIEATTHTVIGLSPDWIVSEWDGANGSLIEDYVNSYDEAKPIPLTEEILLKGGIRLDYEFRIGRQGIIITLDKDTGDYHLLFAPNIGAAFTNIKIVEYLHDLQNTIHALTNKELEINLK
jgi:hypothetical protein